MLKDEKIKDSKVAGLVLNADILSTQQGLYRQFQANFCSLSNPPEFGAAQTRPFELGQELPSWAGKLKFSPPHTTNDYWNWISGSILMSTFRGHITASYLYISRALKPIDLFFMPHC
jgi:hypothetical protein